MNRHVLNSRHHFRAFTFASLCAGVIFAGITATALFALFSPSPGLSLGLVIAAVVFAAALLAGILLFVAHMALRDDLDRAASAFETGLASAHLDALTGALSRSYFISELKAHLSSASARPLAFVQIDMDRLKQMNDGAGHAAGDAALKHLASTIERMLPDAIVGRLGGDEFGVIVPGHDNIQAISRVCRQLLDTLSEPITILGRHASISASAGFAVAPLHASQTDDLMSKADLALYKGKHQGRNAVVAFDADMLSDERHRRFIERELHAAILMDELDLHYQPIVRANGDMLIAYEALVRWQHPVRGMIPPSEFIPVAESGELIEKLGEWVLKRACADFAALEAPRLSINVSPIQLRRADFAARVAMILEEAGVLPEAIAIEITENVPLADDGAEKANLDALKALGVQLAIDDFGSGNASLSYLKRAPFDILKIDRSYVENVAGNRLDALMIASICRIARAANMTVIAEGIETDEQQRAVTAAGATALQGFHLGRPQPLTAILAARRANAA